MLDRSARQQARRAVATIIAPRYLISSASFSLRFRQPRAAAAKRRRRPAPRLPTAPVSGSTRSPVGAVRQQHRPLPRRVSHPANRAQPHRRPDRRSAAAPPPDRPGRCQPTSPLLQGGQAPHSRAVRCLPAARPGAPIRSAIVVGIAVVVAERSCFIGARLVLLAVRGLRVGCLPAPHSGFDRPTCPIPIPIPPSFRAQAGFLPIRRRCRGRRPHFPFSAGPPFQRRLPLPIGVFGPTAACAAEDELSAPSIPVLPELVPPCAELPPLPLPLPPSPATEFSRPALAPKLPSPAELRPTPSMSPPLPLSGVPSHDHSHARHRRPTPRRCRQDLGIGARPPLRCASPPAPGKNPARTVAQGCGIDAIACVQICGKFRRLPAPRARSTIGPCNIVVGGAATVANARPRAARPPAGSESSPAPIHLQAGSLVAANCAVRA